MSSHLRNLTIALLICSSLAVISAAQARDYDLVILNGRVMDPETNLDAVRNVAFRLELVTDNNGRESIRWHGIQNGQEVVLDSEPYVGFWTKVEVAFLKLLPIDSYL